MKRKTCHIIRIQYKDGHVNQRSFFNKDVALKWLKYRTLIASTERVYYAGTVQSDIYDKLMRKNERMAIKSMSKKHWYNRMRYH